MPRFDVHSYHLNVGAGDSAIHLLVETTSSAAGDVWTVNRAVLVDGGRGIGFPALVSAIDQLPTWYTITTTFGGHPQLQFDSIVVTHWDDDHYTGIERLLSSDLQDQWKAAGSTTSPKDLRSRYMKYDMSATPPEPQTFFYAPYWEAGDTNDKKGKPRPPGHISSWRKKVDGTAEFLDVCVGKVKADGDWVHKVAILCTETGYEKSDPKVGMIGRDLFTNSPRVKADLTKIGAPAELLSATTTAPGLFCIGADSIVIGHGNVLEAPGTPDMPIVIEGGENTPVNRASIICVILAPNGTVLHYFGGDVAFESEKLLVGWFHKSTTPPSLPPRILALKLGHHGAATSTPTAMLKELRPTTVVASCGSEYGHPRYEVLMYLQALFNWKEGRVLSTTYPYWFVLVSRFSIKAINGGDGPGGAFKTWRQELRDMAATGYPPFNDATFASINGLDFDKAPWDTLMSAMSDAAIKSKVMEACERWWPTRSDTDNTHTAFSCSTHIQSKKAGSCTFVAKGDELLSWLLQFEQDPATGEYHHLECLPWLYGADTLIRLNYIPTDITEERKALPPRTHFPTADVGPAGNTREMLKIRRGATAPVAATAAADPKALAVKRRRDSFSLSRRPGEIAASLNPVEPSRVAEFVPKDIPPSVTPSCFASSVWQDFVQFLDPVQRDSNFVLLAPADAKSNLDTFVSWLSNNTVELAADSIKASQPQPKHSSQDAVSVSLAAHDPWYLWMRLFQNIPASQFSFSALLNANPWQLSGFTYVMDAQTSLSDTFSLCFSTQYAADQLRPESSLYTDGSVQDAGMVVLGLQPGSNFPPTLSLADVATLVQFRSGKSAALPSDLRSDWSLPLYGLAGTIGLTVDEGPDQQGQGPRNCIWFSSADSYLTTLRLQFKIDEGPVQSWLQTHFLSGIIAFTGSPLVIARKIARPRLDSADFMDGSAFMGMQLNAAIMIQLPLRLETFDFELFFNFGLHSAELIFVNTQQAAPNGSVDAMLGAFEKAIHVQGSSSLRLPNITAHLPDWADSKDLVLRQVNVVVSNDDSQPRVLSVAVEFEFPISMGKAQRLFHLRFSWPSETFTASLWVPPAPVLIDDLEWTSDLIDLRCLPEYESYMYGECMNANLKVASVEITDLIPGGSVKIDHPPEGIDLEVKQLTLSITLEPDVSVEFVAAIGSSDQTSGAVPPILIDTVDLLATYTRRADKTTSLSLTLIVALDIIPDDVEKDGDVGARLLGQFDYDSEKSAALKSSANTSAWSFSGTLRTLKFSWLRDFMDPLAKDFLVELLAEVDVQYLNVAYDYEASGTKSAVAKSFTFEGIIQISELTFGLSYVYDNSGWEFRAALGGSNGTTYLKDVLLKFCPSEIVNLIPEFCNIVLGDVKAPSDLPGPLQPRGSRAGLDEVLISHKATLPHPYVLFVLNLTLSNGHNLTFLQIRYDKVKDQPSAPSPKRIISYTSKIFPDMDGPVPTVNSLPQPFDEMNFVWVHDDSGEGILRSDLAIINTEDVLPESLWIPYKDTIAPVSAQQGTDVLLSVGCHFIVSSSSTAILDYNFGAPAPKSPTALARRKATRDPAPEPEPAPEDESSTPTMGPLHRTFGPLSIANMGLQVSGERLSIHLDASLQIGPIEFGVLNLRLEFTFREKSTLADFRNITVTPYLDGLQADFNQPPLTIAGLFVKRDEIYSGGVDVSMEPYTFMAVGTYGQMDEDVSGMVWPASEQPPKPATGTPAQFKTIFVYGELDGPILDLGFMEIVGVKLGFGYNSRLRNPDLPQLSIFPFIQSQSLIPSTSANNNPLEILSGFCAPVPLTDPTPWVSPKNDSLWFALGLTIVAFEMLTVSAIVVVDLQPSVSLHIFADAIAALPGDGSDANDSFVYAEIQIVSCVTFDLGSMMADGKLAPNSFLLDPACHLGGQFGMRYWFGKSFYAGDWVYTVGGYHPAYHAPQHYPSCERISISWELDSNLSMTGAAYFAITPKAAMGGGSLSAVFILGPLSAHFDAYADFLINFNKFYFQGDIGVSVGIEFSMDLFFFTLHISCDIGATLEIEGPPFGGIAHVDFWVFGFDIAFGHSPVTPRALIWNEFWDLLVQKSTNASLAAHGAKLPADVPATAGANTTFIFNVVSGSIPSKAQMHTPAQGGPPAAPSVESEPTAQVKPQSKLTTGPLSAGADWMVRAGTFSFRVDSKVPFTEYSCNGATPVKFDPADCTFFIKPMHIDERIDSSSLKVTITSPDVPQDEIGEFGISVVTKLAPSSIWSCYDQHADPSIPNGDYSELLKPDNPTISLPMSLQFHVPKPTLMGMIPEFNAMEAISKDVNTDGVPDPSIPSSGILAQTSCLPTYRCSVDGSDSISAWKNAENLWRSSISRRAAAIDGWIGFFGWEKEELNRDVPVALIAEFEQVFLAGPFPSVKQRSQQSVLRAVSITGYDLAQQLRADVRPCCR
ncbi:uncharacterized protein EI97DRAFT_435947 [Westerdykella ornata]|uniref:DUF6603 domain-containing protein n=1 Tax=Westerdykella ornata TaxID=318751 RepID=A0A6A6JB86_WESOR|nr:uncharacterized protein EI97DRAFT_435947 [Westerdykella ornata]KAF2273527.1 hypothetical protein EI97DRAFT_435947 [Westerdykella ornata]